MGTSWNHLWRFLVQHDLHITAPTKQQVNTVGPGAPRTRQTLEPSLAFLGPTLPAHNTSHETKSGNHQASSASDAPNSSHNNSENIETSVAAVWRFRCGPRPMFSKLLLKTRKHLGTPSREHIFITHIKPQQCYKPDSAWNRKRRSFEMSSRVFAARARLDGKRSLFMPKSRK